MPASPAAPRDPTRARGSTSSETRSPPPHTSTTSPSDPSSAATGSVSRRLVIDPIHGHTREETRDERRARKDRERQLRDQAAATSTSAQPSSSRLPTSASSTSNSSSSTSTSSKSVLTIALQRAQSAVLLDSANNFPAAISAYSQSVRLLKEVMARVESKGLGGIEMERKGSTGSAISILSTGSSSLARRESETLEEWEKRKTRWEKKEKAKADEARRLRVIHDTYEDRIKMLLAMNPSLASSVSPSLAASILPTSTSNPSRLSTQASGNPPSPTAASMRFHRRRSSTELPQLQTQPRNATHRSTPSSSSSRSASRPTSPALAQVGQAMLSGELASPISPLAPTSSSVNGIPRIAQLPVISPSTSLQDLAYSASDAPPDHAYPSHLGPMMSQSRPLSTASDATAKALPLSGTVTPTAPSSSHARTAAPAPPPSTSLPPPPPDHPPPPIPIVANRASGSSGSTEADDGDDQRIPVTALEYGQDWPREEVRDSGLNLPVVDRDPLTGEDDAESTRKPSFSPNEERASALPMASTNSSPMRRGSSASAVYTLQSSRQTADVFPSMATRGVGGGPPSSASMAMRRTMSSEGSNPTSVLRPARSASLASQGGQPGHQVYSSGMIPSLSAGSHHSTNSSFSIGNYARSITPAASTTPTAEDGIGSGLVSSSTAGGTISQRRLAGGLTGPPGDAAGGPSEHLEATIVVRAPSQESYRSSQSQGYDEFGNRTSSASSGGGFGSLPGRLRALSQPNQKRPKLPTSATGSWIADTNAAATTNSPPVPPLLSQHASTASNSHRQHGPSLSISSTTTASAGRKPSVPTPTSLNAPPFPTSLGRSNSSSSVGSSASGRYSDRSLPPPVPSTTATSLSHHHVTTSQSTFGGLPSPPTRSSASSRETVMSIPPVRRPFHLMRLVLATMPTAHPATSPSASRSSVISLASSSTSPGGGGYLSEKLYVPSQVWSIPGSKLVSLDTKVRMMEIVLSSLTQLSQVGQSLLSPALANTARNSGSGGERWCLDEATRFMRELEHFEGVVEGVQNTLAKKLGGGLINPTGGGIGNSAFNDKEFGGLASGSGRDAGIGSGSGKDGRKGSTAGGQFASWSSKFQRGFDRVTNASGVSLDSQVTYAETIARLFRQSQCIDHHLALLLWHSGSATGQPEVSAYTLLPASERHRLERQLRRASEFFGTVVCRFVMKDIGLLLDKYVKRGGAWLSGE
ncbi:hypothetical protein JCM3766R1_001038 [Sporobolomyces carnicolor]